MVPIVEQFMSVLEPLGLNLYGVVSASSYDQTANLALQTKVLAPGTRSIIVFASSGGKLWQAFTDDLASDPHHLTGESHPLDAYVERSLAAASRSVDGIAHRWFTPTMNAEVHLDFRSLAVQAGLGVESRLGLVIRPDVGPWLGLRAACFVATDIPPSVPIDDVCGDCIGYCERACPGDAFTNGAWDVSKCASFHEVDARCAQGCDARMACPVGVQHRYSDFQRVYHYDQETGRRLLAQYLNIAEDDRRAAGLDWSQWAGSAHKNTAED